MDPPGSRLEISVGMIEYIDPDYVGSIRQYNRYEPQQFRHLTSIFKNDASATEKERKRERFIEWDRS